MKLIDFLDFIISGAFALAAYLFYLIHKDNIKISKEKLGEKGMFIWIKKVKSFFAISFLIVLCLIYFFSFLNKVV